MKKPDLCLILLCDNVKKVNDKFTYEGDINTINSRSFPVEHRAFFIVTKWINGEGVGFKQTLRIISEENGQEIFNSTPEYSTHYSIEKFSDGKYNTLDYEEDAYLKTFPCMLNVDAGDYMMVTGNRLPDGSVMAMLKFFRLLPDQKMNLSITLRKAKAEHKVICNMNPDYSFIDTKTFNSTKISDYNNKKNTILLWVDVDKEPTRHAVLDIGKLKTNFDKWDGNFAAIFNKKSIPDVNKLKGLPQQTVYFIDKNDVLKEIEKTTNQKLSNNLPVFVVLNEKGEIIYLSNGYKIGAGEMLLKLF